MTDIIIFDQQNFLSIFPHTLTVNIALVFIFLIY